MAMGFSEEEVRLNAGGNGRIVFCGMDPKVDKWKCCIFVFSMGFTQLFGRFW